MPSPHPYFANSLPGQSDWPIALAHRGADIQRENTLTAVRRAIDAGFGYIEIDVRTTADNKVVVFHDETLDRITTGTGKLGGTTWDELASVQIIGAAPRDEQISEPLVLFEELLAMFPTTRFNVDLKDRASAAPMVEILRRQNAWDRVLIASFRDTHRRLFFNSLRPTDPPVASSGGMETVAQLLLAHRTGAFKTVARRLRRKLPLDAVQVPIRKGPIRVVTQQFVDACHTAGIAVHAWVINDPQQMQSLLAMGVDGIVTDNRPAIARVFGPRGAWPQWEQHHES